MATFGVTNLFGLSAPSVGYVAESSRRKSIETIKLPDQLGVTRCVEPKRLVTVEASINGQGDAGLGAMTTVTVSATSTLTVTSRRRTENNSEYPDFDISAESFEDLTTSDPGDAPDPPDGESVGAGCPIKGIQSVGIASVTTFEIEESFNGETPVLLNTDGTFGEKTYYDEFFTFSVRGKGDLPAVLALGTDGGLPATVTEFANGVTIITGTDENQKNTDYPDFSADGEHWPNAS